MYICILFLIRSQNLRVALTKTKHIGSIKMSSLIIYPFHWNHYWVSLPINWIYFLKYKILESFMLSQTRDGGVGSALPCELCGESCTWETGIHGERKSGRFIVPTFSPPFCTRAYVHRRPVFRIIHWIYYDKTKKNESIKHNYE